jgi:hypothetical protein
MFSPAQNKLIGIPRMPIEDRRSGHCWQRQIALRFRSQARSNHAKHKVSARIAGRAFVPRPAGRQHRQPKPIARLLVASARRLYRVLPNSGETMIIAAIASMQRQATSPIA